MDTINIGNEQSRKKKYLKTEVIVVVGNSRSILEKIWLRNRCLDLVIKFNDYIIKVYEEYVDNKTNVWAFNGNVLSESRNIDELKPYYCFLITCVK